MGQVEEAAQRAAGLTSAVRSAMEAAAAGALMPRYRKLRTSEREEKESGEVVTIADRDSEAMLRDSLHRLLPEAAIVGEEGSHGQAFPAHALGSDWCWIVDPLDGTGYFAAGEGPFGIMVALATAGEVAGGWILDPVSGRFCHAVASGGAWIDGERVSAERPSPRVKAGLSPLLKRNADRYAAVIGRLQGQFDFIEIPRCAAAHYPAMVQGAADLTVYERVLPWDHAPGALFLREAGGAIAWLDGSSYRVDQERTGLLAATSPALLNDALAALRDLPA